MSEDPYAEYRPYMSHPHRLYEVRDMDNDQQGVFATETIPAGTIIGFFKGRVVGKPTRHSITYTPTGESVEPEINGIRLPLSNLNHACGPLDGSPSEDPEGPNAKLEGRWVIATREIPEGKEIKIDYRLTEQTISAPFTCKCGSRDCCHGIIESRPPAEQASKEKGR